MAEANLTAERLREVLHYNPDTGVFTWVRPPLRGHVKPGMVAASRVSNGYLRVKIDTQPYLLHRLAWFWVHGEWPVIIDHLNGKPDDNRIANLRNVDHRINMQNKHIAASNSTTGLLGAGAHAGGWRATIRFEGRNIHLGRFKSAEEAHEFYLKVKRRLHDGCTI